MDTRFDIYVCEELLSEIINVARRDKIRKRVSENELQQLRLENDKVLNSVSNMEMVSHSHNNKDILDQITQAEPSVYVGTLPPKDPRTLWVDTTEEYIITQTPVIQEFKDSIEKIKSQLLELNSKLDNFKLLYHPDEETNTD